MPRFRVTPRARNDLKAIGRYSTQRWGKRQRDIYLRAIQNRFQWLAENPGLGRHRAEIHEAYYSFPQGEHVIFYIITEHEIAIIGVLHRAMDIALQLPPDGN